MIHKYTTVILCNMYTTVTQEKPRHAGRGGGASGLQWGFLPALPVPVNADRAFRGLERGKRGSFGRPKNAIAGSVRLHFKITVIVEAFAALQYVCIVTARRGCAVAVYLSSYTHFLPSFHSGAGRRAGRPAVVLFDGQTVKTQRVSVGNRIALGYSVKPEKHTFEIAGINPFPG